MTLPYRPFPVLDTARRMQADAARLAESLAKAIGAAEAGLFDEARLRELETALAALAPAFPYAQYPLGETALNVDSLADQPHRPYTQCPDCVVCECLGD